MNEVLDYPSNKLHGSVMLKMMPKENSEVATEKVIGSLDYWFKLHTAGNVKDKNVEIMGMIVLLFYRFKTKMYS